MYYLNDIFYLNTLNSLWYDTLYSILRFPILKYFYYELSILPKYIYKPIKQFFMNTCVDGSDAEFVVIDMKEPDETPTDD